MRKLKGDEGKALLLAQELLATDALPEILCDALKQWILGVLDIAVVPSWIIGDQAELEEKPADTTK